MKIIPIGKVIIMCFSGGESSAYMLKLILEKYFKTHRIIITFCNTGEEDEETLLFVEKIKEYYNIEIVYLEYRRKKPKMDKFNAEQIGMQNDFEVVDFETAYRKTQFEIENGYPNHPFRFWIEDYGFPQYPNRTCTREMKERTINRYLSSIGIMPRHRVKCVGIRFDEISKRNPDPTQYYELILQGVTKKDINEFFINMPFRLQIPSYLGNCGACISKGIRSLCTIARKRPEKFNFFNYIAKEFGHDDFTFYREHNSIESIFEKSKDYKIQDQHDNRFDTNEKPEFDEYLDSEGACAGTCEAFS